VCSRVSPGAGPGPCSFGSRSLHGASRCSCWYQLWVWHVCVGLMKVSSVDCAGCVGQSLSVTPSLGPDPNGPLLLCCVSDGGLGWCPHLCHTVCHWTVNCCIWLSFMLFEWFSLCCHVCCCSVVCDSG
jgi:hypothetical protein